MTKAVNASEYQGIPFKRVATPEEEVDVLVAKLDVAGWVTEARKCIEDPRDAFKLVVAEAHFRVGQWGDGDAPRPHVSTVESVECARLCQFKWEFEVRRASSLMIHD